MIKINLEPQRFDRARRREYMRQYRVLFPEKAAASVKAARAKNPLAKRRSNREWFLANTEKARESLRKWRRTHPEASRALGARYRDGQRNANGTATEEQLRARVAFFGGVCAYCGGAYEQLDHAIPLRRGGTNWPANFRPACQRCNGSKGAKTVTEFLAWRAEFDRSL